MGAYIPAICGQELSEYNHSYYLQSCTHRQLSNDGVSLQASLQTGPRIELLHMVGGIYISYHFKYSFFASGLIAGRIFTMKEIFNELDSCFQYCG